MDLLLWIALGFLAGWLGTLFLETHNLKDPVMDILLGISGALAGGYIMNGLISSGPTGINWYSLIVSIAGAFVIIVLGRIMHIMPRK